MIPSPLKGRGESKSVYITVYLLLEIADRVFNAGYVWRFNEWESVNKYLVCKKIIINESLSVYI